MYVIKRSDENPILSPNKEHYFESFATFNMSVIKHKDLYYGFYRAVSAFDSMNEQHIASSIGMAKSKDGEHFKDRMQFVTPSESWDKYGLEDPRISYFEGKYYIFYTALSVYPFSAEGIKVGVAISKDLKKIDEKHLVTPFNAKAMTLFPERIKGKIVVMFSAWTDTKDSKTVFAYLDKIEDLWNEDFWNEWQKNKDNYSIDLKRNDADHIEIGASPLKTKYGWLVVYSHIQNYHRDKSNLDLIFGIEVLILDLKDPKKIIARTRGPILVPEENYELSGYVNNIVFPSGAILKKDKLQIYYGAADTCVCMMSINLKDLIFTIHPKFSKEYSFERFKKNPIIEPRSGFSWEEKGTFNPAVIDLGGKIHIFYRAFSNDNTSTIGYANTKDGFNIKERLDNPVYIPRMGFELKSSPNTFSGCEDPRLTKIGSDVFMCYTAYNGGTPRVAITSIKEKDLISKNWNWTKPFLVTPRDIDDKDACLFPEKFKNGYFILHRVNGQVCGDYLDRLDENHAMVHKCIRIIGPRNNTWDSAKVGIGAVPLKTKKGWLVFYHGVSKSHNTYRVGVVLLDLKDPSIVLARSQDPIFEPIEDYEKNGIVNNVVFPCGAIVRKDIVYLYYGGGDRVVGVATVKLSIILKTLKSNI